MTTVRSQERNIQLQEEWLWPCKSEVKRGSLNCLLGFSGVPLSSLDRGAKPVSGLGSGQTVSYVRHKRINKACVDAILT